MDTSNLKKFATEARSNLIKGVVDRLRTLGFDENGHVEDADRPERLQGGALFHGELKQGDSFDKKWTALESAIKNHPHGPKVGVRQVAEAAAYTWFNRFVAIRILQKNRLIEPQLAYADGGRIPMIVENARSGRLPVLTPDEKIEWERLSDDDSKVLEQFTVLIVAYCHTTPILEKCFGHIDDYTELLLPRNILADGGFIDLLNTTDYITEEDYRQTELIGWLYQFYISEKKDEVFASFKNKKKAEAEDIPAATQIFTPNWIVKYMVQNTLGRIYLDNNKGSDLAKDWKYLVDTPTAPDSIYRYAELESLKVADFASGSGHILNEFFDMLYSFYEEDAYDSREAVECIFRKNLIGIDLDTRAKQLSMFSLLLKACQKNARFVDAKVLPRVYDMPSVCREDFRDTMGHFFAAYNLDDTGYSYQELYDAFALMENAPNFGSTMKFRISSGCRNFIGNCVAQYEDNPQHVEAFGPLVDAFRIILALTDKYSAIAMNPPYMGSGNMNDDLKDYVRSEYPNSKADLFSVFMDVVIERLADNAKYGMINMHSWMFISSFENLRMDLLGNYRIESMIHLGPHTFDELSGEVVQNTAYVVTKASPHQNSGTYFRLVDGNNCGNKERLFLDAISGKTSQNICYRNVLQSNLQQIPGCPIGYWATERDVQNFVNLPSLNDFAIGRVGLITGNSTRFIREWSEVSFKRIGFGIRSNQESITSGYKWFPIHNGGAIRKWYGNLTSVVNWENDGYEMKFDNYLGNRVKSHNYNGNLAFKESFSWNTISTEKFACRYAAPGFMFDTAGPFGQVNEGTNIMSVIGYLNSKVASRYFLLINPTINFPPGCILAQPWNVQNNEIVPSLVTTLMKISKQDWDAHETSWDFQKNELLAMTLEDEDANVQFDIDEAAKCGKMLCIDRAAPEPESLSWRMRVYQGKWERLFKQLHANEEELNRQFIEIYGLQDELTPEVPLDEVTILQQGEISVGKPADCNMSCDAPLVDYEQIEWHEDVVIKQFISYAVGCIMGRYRLDKPGLAIAHPNAAAEEKAPYQYKGETFAMDNDGIIPLMTKDSAFSDNAVNRFTEFLRVSLGAESLTENLNFVEKCLGKTVEDYLAKDFWTDHKKMYQNKPIYWLFSSKKGAFKCITYMHRMDAYTAELVRKNYLLKHIDYLAGKIAGLEQDEANLSSGDRKKLASYRKDYAECIEYDERLQLVASKQIAFDLDDGVVVNYAKFGDVLAKIK